MTTKIFDIFVKKNDIKVYLPSYFLIDELVMIESYVSVVLKIKIRLSS